MTSISEQEREKYQAVWDIPEYHELSDGEGVVDEAYKRMGCKPGDSLIDWGCGSGQSVRRFLTKGLAVAGFDIAANCWPLDLADVPFHVGTIWDPLPGIEADFAFCTDVLEHIPPEHLFQTLDVLRARTHSAAFIQIDTFPDLFGAKMDPPRILHLSLHSHEWWLNRLRERWGTVADSRGTFTRWRFVCWA